MISFFKNFAKIILYLVLLALVGAGVYAGLKIYENETAKSSSFGEIKQHNLYEDFNVFDCDLSDAIFYKSENGYKFNTSIPQKVEFNGNTNKYNVLINNSPSYQESSTAGILTALHKIMYYNLDGTMALDTVLNLEIKFYQSRIEITITNDNDATQEAYFLEYLDFNGLHLRVVEKQYVPETSTNINYTISFLDYDNSVISIKSYLRGASIMVPEAPIREGYKFIGWSPNVDEIAMSNTIYIANYQKVLSLTFSFEKYRLTVGASAWVLRSNDVTNFFEKNDSNILSIVFNGVLESTKNDITYSHEFNNYEIQKSDVGLCDGVRPYNPTPFKITFYDSLGVAHDNYFYFQFDYSGKAFNGDFHYDAMKGLVDFWFTLDKEMSDDYEFFDNDAFTAENFSVTVYYTEN